MSLIRSPFEDLRRLENEISNVFRTFPEVEGYRMIPVNVSENNDEYTIEASIPGYKSDEIDIEATSQYLNIIAQKEEKSEETKDKTLVREISYSKLQRRIAFDKPVDTTKAKTKIENGMLTIMMPKADEAKAVKLIPEVTD